MSAQSSRAATKPAFVKSGAAGAATFPGSDSRKYNYFEPKGRKATHYEDMTVDVQPDPERYLLQDWIISFPDGTPTYCKDWTAAQSSNWHQFRAVDQEWERTHYQRQSTICGMVQNTIENARKSGAPARFDKPGSRSCRTISAPTSMPSSVLAPRRCRRSATATPR